MSVPSVPNMGKLPTISGQDLQTPGMDPTDGTVSLREFFDVCNGNRETAESIIPESTNPNFIHRLKHDPKRGVRVKLSTPEQKTAYAKQHAVRQQSKTVQEMPEFLTIPQLKDYYSKRPQGQFQRDFPEAQLPNGALPYMHTNVLGETMFRNPDHPTTRRIRAVAQATQQAHPYSPETQQMLLQGGQQQAQPPVQPQATAEDGNNQ